MSTEQLTDDERASFLIGLALRRVMTIPGIVPLDILAQAWAGYRAASDHGMTPAEAQEVRQITNLKPARPGLTAPIPTIRTEAELLALLRAGPAKHGVSYYRDERPCVAALDEPARHIVRVLAWIDGGGTAQALLDASYNADCHADAEAWARLPLRYGPFCSTWVLPEHPHATTQAGGEE